LTQEGSETRSKNLFPLLQRAGRLRGIVDYEFSCTRYKIYVPKETCLIPFGLSAIRGPLKDQPFSKEALELAKEVCHQRDIEFDVSLRDKGGNFVGNAWILVNGKKRNLATLFLEEGYASLIPAAARDNENSTELIIAEETAKKKEKKIYGKIMIQLLKKLKDKKKEKQCQNNKNQKLNYLIF